MTASNLIRITINNVDTIATRCEEFNTLFTTLPRQRAIGAISEITNTGAVFFKAPATFTSLPDCYKNIKKLVTNSTDHIQNASVKTIKYIVEIYINGLSFFVLLLEVGRKFVTIKVAHGNVEQFANKVALLQPVLETAAVYIETQRLDKAENYFNDFEANLPRRVWTRRTLTKFIKEHESQKLLKVDIDALLVRVNKLGKGKEHELKRLGHALKDRLKEGIYDQQVTTLANVLSFYGAILSYTPYSHLGVYLRGGAALLSLGNSIKQSISRYAFENQLSLIQRPSNPPKNEKVLDYSRWAFGKLKYISN